MTLQPITYRGRTLAACTRQRVFLSGELEALPLDDPTRLFVLGMCLYAGEVLNGYRRGPYRDQDAYAYVRRLLLSPVRSTGPVLPAGLVAPWMCR
jgi:hypothetical protein